LSRDRRIRIVAEAEKERPALLKNEKAFGLKSLCQGAEMNPSTD
jgi:hypothetical protein